MNKTLNLVFGTAGGKQLHLTLAKPKDGLSDETVKSAMQAMIDSKALGAADGSMITAAIGAQYIERTVSKIF